MGKKENTAIISGENSRALKQSVIPDWVQKRMEHDQRENKGEKGIEYYKRRIRMAELGFPPRGGVEFR